MSQQHLAAYYQAKISMFLASNLLHTGAHESREIIAKIIGFAAPHLPPEQQLSIMQSFLPALDAQEPNVDKIEAAVNTLASVLSLLLIAQSLISNFDRFFICRSLQSESMPPQCKQPTETILTKLASLLSHRSPQIKATIFNLLSQVTIPF